MFDGLAGELIKRDVIEFLLGLGLAAIVIVVIALWSFGSQCFWKFKDWRRSRKLNDQQDSQKYRRLF